MTENDYDTFGSAYSAENATSLLNAYYERPAILDLLGEVRDRRILDGGCGSGPLIAELRDRGADVTGFDASPVMIELARRRLGHGIELHVAELGRPLPFDAGSFDDVVVSLVLHYLPDWTDVLDELHRVLRPGGRLLISVNHPIIYKMAHPENDYFAIERWSDAYVFAGQPAVLTYWHRPLHAMTEAFTAAGFRLTRIAEPPFDPRTPRELIPPELGERTAFLSFIFFVLTADRP